MLKIPSGAIRHGEFRRTRYGLRDGLVLPRPLTQNIPPQRRHVNAPHEQRLDRAACNRAQPTRALQSQGATTRSVQPRVTHPQLAIAGGEPAVRDHSARSPMAPGSLRDTKSVFEFEHAFSLTRGCAARPRGPTSAFAKHGLRRARASAALALS
jgi:hypothetical protein